MECEASSIDTGFAPYRAAFYCRSRLAAALEMQDDDQLFDALLDKSLSSGKKSVLWSTASYIITTEFCERLCYYGFAGSLVLFFQSCLNFSNAESFNAFQLWSGAVYVTPLLGGFIADVYLGRYLTLLAFSCVYVLGLGLFVLAAIPSAVNETLIFLAMYTIALAAGGIKPNASTMGADQFDLKDAQDKRESEKFFSFFYFAINLGALTSYTVVAYIAQYGVSGLGGQEWGFVCAVVLQALVLCVGIAVFVSGSGKYVKKPPQRDFMLGKAACVVVEALSRQSSSRPHSHFLDAAKRSNGGSYSYKLVEAIKLMGKLIPFLCTFILYWAVYSQTKTSFQAQSCQSNLSLGSIQVPVSSLNIFNNLTILALVPLFERCFYPFLKRQGLSLSMQQKILIGFGFALVAMLVSGVVEVFRVKAMPPPGDFESVKGNISPCRNALNYDPSAYLSYVNDGDAFKPTNCHTLSSPECSAQSPLSQSCVECDDVPQMSSQSVFAQIPQFVLIGISEIFASITALEFFYSQAPASMRSVSQASNLLTSALGSWLTIPLTLLVNAGPSPWVTSNIDQTHGHLDWYFFLLGGLQFLVILAYIYLTKSFTPVDPAFLEELGAGYDEDSGEVDARTVQ